jgi:hypothetical protein
VKKALATIKQIYTQANFDPEGKYGLILRPSPTHVHGGVQLVTNRDSIDLPSQETAEKRVARHTFVWSRFLEELKNIRTASAGSGAGKRFISA